MTDADSIWESKRRKRQDPDDQFDQERESNLETRRVITALTARIPAIEAPSETPGSAETGEEQQGRSPNRSGPIPQALRRALPDCGGGER